MLNIPLSEEKYVQGNETSLPAVTSSCLYTWNAFFQNGERNLGDCMSYNDMLK